jgi:hypothetical protein
MSCQVTDMAHVGTDTGFAGLPRGTQAFLRDLEARNDRGWFEANRARYETDWLAPARALTAALATPCAVLEPPLRAEPKINGSIRRLQRDAAVAGLAVRAGLRCRNETGKAIPRATSQATWRSA